MGEYISIDFKQSFVASDRHHNALLGFLIGYTEHEPRPDEDGAAFPVPQEWFRENLTHWRSLLLDLIGAGYVAVKGWHPKLVSTPERPLGFGLTPAGVAYLEKFFDVKDFDGWSRENPDVCRSFIGVEVVSRFHRKGDAKPRYHAA